MVQGEANVSAGTGGSLSLQGEGGGEGRPRTFLKPGADSAQARGPRHDYRSESGVSVWYHAAPAGPLARDCTAPDAAGFIRPTAL